MVRTVDCERLPSHRLQQYLRGQRRLINFEGPRDIARCFVLGGGRLRSTSFDIDRNEFDARSCVTLAVDLFTTLPLLLHTLGCYALPNMLTSFATRPELAFK